MKFEEIMSKLEELAGELENGELSLEESVTKFEQAMELSQKCNEILESAEKRITILITDGDNMKEENFIQEEE